MTKQQKFIAMNRSYRKLNAIGLCLHDTATPGATANNEYVYFNRGADGRKASVHGFVDWDTYVQTVPYDEEAWHAGYTANKKYIGIEMCLPYGHDEAKFKKVYNNTVQIFAELCIIYGWTSDNIVTHHECSMLWHETDHTDPTSYFKEYGKNINIFRDDVDKKINEIKGELTMTQYEELKAEIQKLKKPIYNYIDDNSAKIAEDANDALRAAIKKGILKGSDNGLNLTEDMIRIHIWNYRLGLYD